MKLEIPRIAPVLTLAAALSYGWSTHAQNFVINLPDLILEQDTMEQGFDIFVQNNEASPITVDGIFFSVEVAGAAAGSVSDVDLINGTPFEGDNTGPGGSGFNGTFFERSTTTSGGTVDLPVGSQKIATIIFDTTGIAPGTYNYTLNAGGGPPTATSFTIPGGDFINPTLGDGTLTVIPEPGTTAVVAGVLCLGVGAAYRIRQRRAQA